MKVSLYGDECISSHRSFLPKEEGACQTVKWPVSFISSYFGLRILSICLVNNAGKNKATCREL